jgi:hydrogenase maturation protease
LTIVGVGNPFRGDDAAGLVAARRLRGALPGARVLEQEADAAALLDSWKGEDAVIVIDAVSSGAPPGTVHRFEAHERPVPSRLLRGSTHALGVADAIELARVLGWLPRRVVVYGIEGGSFAPGEGLSPEVGRAVEEIVGRVVAEARRDA